MSGSSSSRNRSKIGTRARTELIFQEAILSVVTFGPVADFVGKRRTFCYQSPGLIAKGPCSGGMEQGPTKRCHARRSQRDPGNRGKPRFAAISTRYTPEKL